MGLLETGQAGEVQAVHLWGIGSVEEALIACHDLWWRTPGGGRWPYAGDGPWHLIQGEAGDYAGDGQDGVSSSAKPRIGLDLAEVAVRERVSVWVPTLENADERIIVREALPYRARDERPGWKHMAQTIRFPVFDDYGDLVGTRRWARSYSNMGWHYYHGLACIACRLNGWSTRRARAMVARWHAAE